MLKVTIVGTGNVSHHLQHAFSNAKNLHLLEVLSSRVEGFDAQHNNLLKRDIGEEPDIYFIAVSDDAIEPVSQYFRTTKKLVVHTSGSTDINALPQTIRKGVFYPLQSFSKKRKVNFSTIPICLEATHRRDMQLLKQVAHELSGTVHEINSQQRRALHLAAVFVNNFTNHLYHNGNELCEENGLSFDLLKPLITETAAKITSLSPREAQTGPAKRNDEKTILNHLGQLNNAKQQKIYTMLTESIKTTYGEEL